MPGQLTPAGVRHQPTFPPLSVDLSWSARVTAGRRNFTSLATPMLYDIDPILFNRLFAADHLSRRRRRPMPESITSSRPAGGQNLTDTAELHSGRHHSEESLSVSLTWQISPLAIPPHSRTCAAHLLQAEPRAWRGHKNHPLVPSWDGVAACSSILSGRDGFSYRRHPHRFSQACQQYWTPLVYIATLPCTTRHAGAEPNAALPVPANQPTPKDFIADSINLLKGRHHANHLRPRRNDRWG